MSIIGLPPQGDEDWYDYATSLDTEARTIASKETPAGAQAKADAALAAANAAAPGLAPVQSVNGQTGAVVIATGGTADITTHEGAADPHAGYLLEATASATYSPLPPTGGTLVYATEDQAVADANPGFTWLVLTPAEGGDTTVPTAPTSLAATDGDTQSVLTWTQGTDAVGVTQNRIYRDGVALATITAATTYTATGLTNGTPYSFTVSALDAAGNESAQSAADVATPAASGDVTDPTAPTLSATDGDTESVLTWSAAADDTAVTGYKVYKDAVLLATLGNVLTYTATGLTNGTSYAFTVTALDAAGNESVPSNTDTVTPVGAGAFAPTDLSGLAVWYDLDQMPVVVDGTGVASLTDFSGNARHATQATGGSRPLYYSSVVNGLPVLRSSSINHFLATAAAQFVGADGTWSAFLVGSKVVSSSTLVYLASDDSASTATRLAQFLLHDGTGTLTLRSLAFDSANTAKIDTGPTAPEGVFTVLSAVRDTSNLEAKVNGVGNGATAAGTAKVATLPLTVFRATGGTTRSGDLAEALIYNRALTSGEQTQVVDYLKAKYAIA